MRITDREIDLQFSQAVIAGLNLCGYSDAEIICIARLGPRHLNAIRAGQRAIGGATRRRLEDHTGKTAGQLAALTLEPNGGPLTELLEVSAKVVDSLRPGWRSRP
jgi:hypothetical protein